MYLTIIFSNVYCYIHNLSAKDGYRSSFGEHFPRTTWCTVYSWNTAARF